MTRRLLLGYLGLTALVLLVLEVPLGVTFARRERDALVADVRRDTESIARFATGPLAEEDYGPLGNVVLGYEQATGGRVVVTDADGRSVADSTGTPGRSFASRPEVEDALGGTETSGFRRSETLDQRLLFVAVPVDPAGEVVGTVRVTYPAEIVDDRIRRTWLVLAGVALVTLAAVTVLGWWMARSLARPVRDIEGAARRLGDGDLAARAPVPSGPAELRGLAEELNESAARLERLVGGQSEFVADVSHQLRTPLTALRLRLDVLEGDLDEDAAAEVGAALTEVDRLSRLVDGLLALARAEQSPSDPERVDLHEVLEDRRRAWGPLADENDVEITVRVDGPVRALVTSGHLEQTLDNLISNAIEVSPAGHHIWLTASQTDAVVDVHVVDAGPGMSAEERARAFDRFRSGGEDSGRGFGLGLAIAQRLTSVDGGHLALDAASTGGLDAHLRLRAAATD